MTTSLPLDTVTAETFSPHIGTRFELSIEEGSPPVATLVLTDATASKLTGPARVPFSLMFEGPAEPALTQQIYWLEHADLGVAAIFLVPVSGNRDKRQYQAVFS